MTTAVLPGEAVNIRAADAGSEDLHQDFVGAGLRVGAFFDADIPWTVEDECSHSPYCAGFSDARERFRRYRP
jgi:hypothetical protein